MSTSELIRITISRRTGEELAREVHEVPVTLSRSWLDVVADVLYDRAVKTGAIPAPQMATGASVGQNDRSA